MQLQWVAVIKEMVELLDASTADRMDVVFRVTKHEPNAVKTPKSSGRQYWEVNVILLPFYFRLLFPVPSKPTVWFQSSAFPGARAMESNNHCKASHDRVNIKQTTG